MRRRSKAGSEPVKRRGHHVSGQKPGKALNRRASTADLQQQLDRRTHERDEALEQQAATAEVLKVISHSAFDLQTVLDALTESAAALCQADMAGMARPRETAYHWVTTYGFSADFLEHVMNVPLSPGRGSVVGRALLERRAIQIADVLADPEYTYIAVQKRGGFRSVLGVPLLREENPIGVFFWPANHR